jgi:putative flippase GtrA
MSTYLKSFVNRETLSQIIRVGFIGGFNTVVYFVLLNVFLDAFGRFWAVTGAFVLATALSYVLNRRWSFQIEDGSVGSAKETATFFIVNLVAWSVTIIVMEFANAQWGPLTRIEVNLAAMVAAGFIVLPKFAAYRDVVFKKSLEASV